jgi:hypothetical protein
MAQLLDLQPEDNEALARFHALMGELATSKDVVIAPEDNGEASGLLEQSPVQVFERLGAEVQPMSDEGGAAGFGNPFRLLWADAKEALRQATYWEMKKRAGIIGKSGLGSVIDKIRQVQPNLQIHLVGHSFGARLVSYALLGLSQAHETPIRSLVLMQGAFSHWAFAQPLPFDPARNGALADMEQQVKGVIVVIHSLHDSAVGTFYPLASIASGEDAAAFDDIVFRWGAMGYDGAQGVSVQAALIGDVGHSTRLPRISLSILMALGSLHKASRRQAHTVTYSTLRWRGRLFRLQASLREAWSRPKTNILIDTLRSSTQHLR